MTWDDPDDAVRCSTCGHVREKHEHYRRGSDCSVDGCGCRRFVAAADFGHPGPPLAPPSR